MADSGDRTNEVLAAIAALSDRVGSLETIVERMDRKLNAVSRKLLAPIELVGLGIQDGRKDSGGGEANALPRAAKSDRR